MSKYMTFVFDDGPNELLYVMVDKFKSYGFKAAFAIIGHSVNDETEDMLKYAVCNGFELVSHSYSHIHLEKLEKRQEIIYELTEPIREVEKRIGYKITMARLPFISYNDEVLEITERLKLPLLGCGLDGGRDWANDTTPEIIAKAILSTACDGGVACLHVRKMTLEALDVILPELKKRGYVLTTPKELFEIKGIKNIPLGVNIDNVNDFLQ